MQTPHTLLALLLSATLPLAALAADPPPSAPATGAGPIAEAAGERCEAAVTDTIREMRGDDGRQVQFVRARRSVLPPVNDETDVKGEGSYRGGSAAARPFSYRCAYNVKSDTTSGVVFKDIGPARADSGAETRWQPDLTALSPEACEAAVASVLKSKHPRVGRIAFGSDSRKLRAATNGRTAMEGEGSVERAPGMNLIAFSYACEYEPRTGKVVVARTTP
ncbi:hypothetical protein [Rhizobacter sp. Root1221]|uniref:hypothetical protein n=1 Tax=Rhizobacter sp. Root1221 TaxID=1736433 RepID=UPI0006F5EB12|nr:hypothetical protein [Rhizobacter sp. Root1221]KQV81266.1 hypothetical protein ASC87_10085 [Rhizobacter sp. Root1221]